MPKGRQTTNAVLTLHYQGEFGSARWQSRWHGQNLCWSFLKAVLPTTVEESTCTMEADGKTEVLISPPPWWVLAPTIIHLGQCMAVITMVWSESYAISNIIYIIIYTAQLFPYQECNYE